jgi:SRSO17 transposase
LLSNLDHKNVESIAYRFGQERMPLQWFVGKSDWDHEPLRDELVRQVGKQLGEEDGVIVFDPSGFPQIWERFRRRRAAVVRSAGQGR